jgi:hypothetical protein
MYGSWLAIIFSTALTAAGLAQPQAGSRLKRQGPVPTLDLRQHLKPKPPQECEA